MTITIKQPDCVRFPPPRQSNPPRRKWLLLFQGLPSGKGGFVKLDEISGGERAGIKAGGPLARGFGGQCWKALRFLRQRSGGQRLEPVSWAALEVSPATLPRRFARSKFIAGAGGRILHSTAPPRAASNQRRDREQFRNARSTDSPPRALPRAWVSIAAAPA